MQKINEILDIKNLDEALNASKSLIFKNSMKCPVSLEAKKKIEEFAELCSEKIKLYIVDVISNRDLSSEITERTGIKHQSPQVILLENGKAKWSKSHWEITLESLKKAL